MASENEINALIQLLDDNDQEVFRHVHDKLKSFGPDVIPTLEQAWGSELNPTAHERIEEIIHEIQFESLIEEWTLWLSGNENPDLFTGAFLVAKYHYPELRFEEVQKKIFKIKQSIWLELNYNQTPLEQIQIFNQVFYTHHGFKGAQSSSDFQDFCINHALEAKKGNSFSIGIIYQVLANELNLPVYGVNLVRHYVLAFCKKMIFDFSTEDNLEREVMFYINPINKGSIFSRSEIKDYLEKMRVENSDIYFAPAANISVITELLKSLVEIYDQQNRSDRVRELTLLSKLM
ncbi:MAG: transglutaminase-like domain-containing protein [Bacteroidota bacterium]